MSELKAYQVDDKWGDHGTEIVYAETAGKAKALGLCEWVPEFTAKSVKRAPEFDKYFPKGPSRSVLLRHGWFFECNCCCKKVFDDTKGRVVTRNAVFCNRQCWVKGQPQ